MALVVEHPPSKCKVLNSNPITERKREKGRERERQREREREERERVPT
jgi:hypothetical protein